MGLSDPALQRWNLALDVDDEAKAMELARLVAPYVGGFKVGPRLALRSSRDFIMRLSQLRPVFLDCKFHDIPSTVVSAVRAAFDMGAHDVTVHAANGRTCLKALAELEAELQSLRSFRILVVTVLTSLKPEDWPSFMQMSGSERQVAEWAQLALEAGLSGVVCSGHEVERLRQAYPEAYLVVPGIRTTDLPVAGRDDQSRIMGPKEAIERGASRIIVGRPILEARNPAQAAQSIYEALQFHHTKR